MEQLEFSEMGSLFLPLFEGGHITDIEYRNLESTDSLESRQAAVYRIAVSKSRRKATIIMEVFRKINIKFRKMWRRLDSPKSEQIANPVVGESGKHPLLINVVATCIFEFLPLKDIRRCRLVCRDWCSTADPILRKRAAIQFTPENLSPITFSKFFKNADLPFTSFTFSDNETGWQPSELKIFFDGCGKDIKSLKLINMSVKEKNANLYQYDITHCILKMPNLVELLVDCKLSETMLFLPLLELPSLRSLILKKCIILQRGNNDNVWIAPFKISLKKIRAVLDGKIVKNFDLREYMDLRQSSNINIDDSGNLNLSKQVFNADEVRVSKTPVINWTECTGRIKLLNLYRSPLFTDRNNLNIKFLRVENSFIVLSVLPESIEKIHVSKSDFNCNDPSPLPNLKYLYIEDGLEVENPNSHVMNYFSNYSNLYELEIDESMHRWGYVDWTLNLSCLPRTLKKLKINNYRFKIPDESPTFELDTLILVGFLKRIIKNEAKTRMPKFKPKILVVSCQEASHAAWQHDADDVVQLVLENSHVQKIIIGSHNDTDWYYKKPFEKSTLSQCVDQKGNHYIFENKVGQAITHEEFLRWRKLDDIDSEAT